MSIDYVHKCSSVLFVSYFIIANVTPRCLYLNRPDIAHCFGTLPHQAGKEGVLGLWHLEALLIHVLGLWYLELYIYMFYQVPESSENPGCVSRRA